MLTMTMISILRDQLLRGLEESSNIYEVSKKNSEDHVRVMQDRCTLFLRHLSRLLIHGLLEVGKLKSGEKST